MLEMQEQFPVNAGIQSAAHKLLNDSSILLPKLILAHRPALQRIKESWHMKFNGLITTLWVRAYLNALGKGLRKKGIAEAKQILKSIERDTKAYFDEDSQRPDYDTTALVSAQCSVVLAAYQNLARLFDEKDAALALVNEAMGRTWRTRSDMYFKFIISIFRDPLKNFKKLDFVKLVQRMMGPGMELDQHSSENSITLTIHRCAYNRFLCRHDAAYLNPVFCHWDGIWMDIYNRSSRPIQVARPSCKSYGHDTCCFVYSREYDKPVETKDILTSQNDGH